MEAAAAGNGAWLLVADAARQRALRPLIDAHAARRPVFVRMPGEHALRDLEGVAAVMAVGGAGAPRTGAASPFLRDGARLIPMGWLPAAAPGALARFAAAAAAVCERRAAPPSVAILAQWDDYALHCAARSASLLAAGARAPGEVNLWTADRIIRRDLLRALRLGPSVALYFGHGRAYGWAGYHGLHLHHLPHARGQPCGAVLSLTCSTATRSKGRRSFCEQLVLEGIAAAALGAVAPTRSTDNWRWGLGVSRALAAGRARTLGEALLAALPTPDDRWAALGDYRLVGDPAAALGSTPETLGACAAVAAPAPDASVAELRAQAARAAGAGR